MKQSKFIVLLAMAVLAGCRAQSPALSIENSDAPKVHQAGVNVDQLAASASRVAQAGAKRHDATSDNGLFRPSFDECVTDAAGVMPDTQACIEDEFEFHDARLQAVYYKQQLLLQGETLQSLKQAQEAWLAERQKECAWDPVHEGQGQRLDANYCNLRSTAMRANDLEKALANQK